MQYTLCLGQTSVYHYNLRRHLWNWVSYGPLLNRPTILSTRLVEIFKIYAHPPFAIAYACKWLTNLSFILASSFDPILTVFSGCSYWMPLFRPLYMVHAFHFLHHFFSCCCIATSCNHLVSFYHSHIVVHPILQSHIIVGHYNPTDSKQRHA